MLPEIPDTVAVFGGGKNVSWADNDWICTKRKVAYWGDLDQSGFKILAQFRHKAGFQIPSLMMDPGTIEKHLERMCMDDSGETDCLVALFNPICSIFVRNRPLSAADLHQSSLPSEHQHSTFPSLPLPGKDADSVLTDRTC